jgi:hypothetical protein
MLIATQVQNYLQHGGYRVEAKREKGTKKCTCKWMRGVERLS